MAAKNKQPAAKKAKSVTVRVLKSKKTEAPKSTPQPQKKPVVHTPVERSEIKPVLQNEQRRQYVWIGAAASFVVIVIAWIFFLKLSPEKDGPNEADLYLQNIGHTLSKAVTDFDNSSTEIKSKFLNISEAMDQNDLHDLKHRAFPQFYE